MGSMPNIVNGKPAYEPAQPSSNENLSQNAGPVAASMNKPSQSNTPVLPSTVTQQNEIHDNANQAPVSVPVNVDNQGNHQTQQQINPVNLPPQQVPSAPLQTNQPPLSIQQIQSNNLQSTSQQQLPNKQPTQPVQSPTVQLGEQPKEPSTQSSNDNHKQSSSQPSEENSSSKQQDSSNEKEGDEDDDDEDSSDDATSEAPKPSNSQTQQATTSEAPKPSINQPHQATGGWNSPQSPTGMGASPNIASLPPVLPAPPAPKEGDGDNDTVPSVGSPPDIKGFTFDKFQSYSLFCTS